MNVYVSCAVQRRRSSAGANPAWQLSLQPVAIGAVVEATKRLKPPVERVARRPGEHVGRNVSERRASLEKHNAEADLLTLREGWHRWVR